MDDSFITKQIVHFLVDKFCSIIRSKDLNDMTKLHLGIIKEFFYFFLYLVLILYKIDISIFRVVVLDEKKIF